MVRDLGELGINMQKIINRLMSNQNLMKLLYYTDKDPLAQPDLTEEQLDKEILEKLVKVVPRVGPKEDAKSMLGMRIVRGTQNSENMEFRDIMIQMEVFVPMTQWLIKNSNLRPFCIMGEILKTINNKNINGLGRITGGNFDLNFLTDEMSCYEMTFWIQDYE